MPLLRRRAVGLETLEITLGRPGERFRFRAGQYVEIFLPRLLSPDARGPSRLFSVASSPNEKDKLIFAFRRSRSGFKQTIAQLPLRTLLRVAGPFGRFLLPSKPQAIVFLAGGVGIVPCLSIIRYAAEESLPHPLTLLYRDRAGLAAPYRRDLVALAGRNPRFTFKIKKGRASPVALKELAPRPRDCLWYLSGPTAMITDTRETLLGLKIDDAQIRTEDFTGY